MCVGAFLLLAAAMDEAVDGKLRLPGVVLGTLLAAGAYSVATIWTNTQPTWGLWPCWGFLLGMLICVGEYPFVPRLLCAGVAVAAASGWVNPLATMSIQTTPFAAVCATGCLVSLWAQFRDRVLLW